MASDSDPIASIANAIMDADDEVIPATPPETTNIPPSSQVALPSTEEADSPVEPSVSFKTETNDDRTDAVLVPSSLTPPPSSQVPTIHHNVSITGGYIASSQQSSLFSPPATVPAPARRTPAVISSEYVAPTPQEVREAPPDVLRAMMQDSTAEHSRLKMETAHYKLQLNLLSLQAGEDAQRAAVEHDMTRREVEALRDAEHIRQARRELSAATESARAKYIQLKGLYEETLDDVEHLERKLKLAKKVIQQQEDEICRLREDRQQLRTRIRENREHLNMLRSPGGIFHSALSPKQNAAAPHHGRTTPKQASRGSRGKMSQDGDQGNRFDVLIQAISQENNSAPSTPTSSYRPAPRQQPKHTRNVQSMSSLPTTPLVPRRGGDGLLPSAHLAPHTEPPRRPNNRRLLPDSPRYPYEEGGRRSRESTISVPDNEELARQALASVQKATSSLSRLSGTGRPPVPPLDEEDEEESDVPQSQASITASQMLRRDPRRSFEVSSQATDRDGSPSPTQTHQFPPKIFPGDRVGGVEKRKFTAINAPDASRGNGLGGSPPKKLRVGGDLPESAKVGLGIKYT